MPLMIKHTMRINTNMRMNTMRTPVAWCLPATHRTASLMHHPKGFNTPTRRPRNLSRAAHAGPAPSYASSQDVVDKLSSESEIFAGLVRAQDLVNQQLIETTNASPAPTLRPGQDAPTTEQLFATPGHDWVVRVQTFAGGDAGLRWMHSVKSVKLVPGFSLALLRTNAAMDAALTAAPAFDFEIGLFNNASILLYLNMPPRVDLLLETDDSYYQRYYQTPVDTSYDALMEAIATDPECKPYRSKSVHIRVYSSTGALVMLPPTKQSVEKITQWGTTAAKVWNAAVHHSASRDVDDKLQAKLAARDAMLRGMPRRDPDNAMAEAALGKEQFEELLQVNAGDLRVD